MTGSDEVEILIMSLLGFDDVTFSDVLQQFRIIILFLVYSEFLRQFYAIICHPRLRKKGDNSKSIRARLINFTFLKRLVKSNPTVPNAMVVSEVEILLTSLPVFDDVTYSGVSRHCE